LLRSSPLDPQAMLRSKYLIGVLPLLILALGLTITTNTLLRASPFMMVVSVGTVLGYTLAIGGLALGIGTLYPQFDSENAAQIPTSFGGLVFMLLAIALLAVVIMIEALPVTQHLRAAQQGAGGGPNAAGWAALIMVVVLCTGAGLVPLRLARQRLSQLEA